MNYFHDVLFDKSEKVIAFAGGGGKSVLINKICQEFKKSGKSALVLSNHPLYVPPDTSIFISHDKNIIRSQINREIGKQQILYLGKSYDEKKISGFKDKDIQEIINSAKCDHILLEVDQTQSRSFSGFDNLNLKTASLANRCIMIIGADALNQPNNDTYLKTNDVFWQNQTILEPVKIVEWLIRHKIIKHLTAHHIPLTIFINKVENIFYKNLTINFARQLKQNEIENVLFGSIYNSEFQSIK
jgi:probable selenium-dependent hydroxylase accessory protein YqeC